MQFGGQTPLNLALPLKAAGVNIIGTSPESIDLAERTASISTSCSKISIFRRAPGVMATSLEEASEGARRIRISRAAAAFLRAAAGRAGHVGIAYDDAGIRLSGIVKEAVEYSHDRPVLIDHFLENAIEVDVDALSDGEDVVIGGIMQHIEEAGIHLRRFVMRVARGRYSTSSARPHARIHVQAGARVESYWPDEHTEFAIPRGDGGSGENGADGGKSLRARSESARLYALCRMFPRRPACPWRKSRRG